MFPHSLLGCLAVAFTVFLGMFVFVGVVYRTQRPANRDEE